MNIFLIMKYFIMLLLSIIYLYKSIIYNKILK
jgi:hypothetical protein